MMSISVLDVVELVVELGWNYMKFHPYSTHNSTLDKPLSIKDITIQGWKGGITNNKKYFSEKRQEKVLTTVKNYTKQDWHFIGKHFLGFLVVGYGLLVRLYYTTDNQLPTTNNQHANTERKRKKAVCNIIAFRLQKLCFYNVITMLSHPNISAIAK